MGGATVKLDAATVPRDPADTGGATPLVSHAGGLTRFGAYSVTLPPSAKATASHRHWHRHWHWHSMEDEFLLVPESTATVIDNNWAHQLGAGDAAVWRKGDPNVHHTLNQSAAPVRCLVIGSRVVEGIVQSCLGDVSTAGLADDWITCRDAVGLPCHIISRVESTVVAALNDQKAGYDPFRATLRAQRVTDYFRRIDNAALHIAPFAASESQTPARGRHYT